MDTATKVLDDAGKAIRTASTKRDIAARKKRAANIRRMATVVRDSNDAITIQDFQGRITAWNRGAELMYGYSKEEAIRMNIGRLTPVDREEEQKDFTRRLIAGEAITSLETRRVTKDGRILDVWLTVTKVMDDAGKPIGIASTERDITEHKRAKEEIEAVAKFPAENPSPVLRIARDGELLYVNEAGASQLHEWHLQVGQVAPPILQDVVAHSMDDKTTREFDTPHGKRVYSLFVVPIVGAGYANLYGRDVTERNKEEESLRQSREKLEQYTAALETANKALEESKHLAECANRAKSEFLANMSHELRTPLNAVIGFSEGLLERADRHPLNEHQKDRLGRIKASGEYLLQLINGVLDIAKAESGKIDLQITTFDVELVVREVGDMAEALAKDKPAVRFTLDLEEHLPPITSDRDKVRQILVNLLGNAVKFTEQGSVTLRVGRNNGSLVFSVEDTGAGISAEHLNRLFEKFYQVEQETHRPLKGTGLGLAISKAFATLLGGTLTVESVEGQGSTFTLAVPLMLDRRKSVDRRQLVQQAPAPRQSPPQGEQRSRILCIEANPTNLVLLNDYLTEAGYQVVPAANGAEGLRLAASQCPQAIILDVMLPGHDGWGILHRLKADPATSNIPVIIATGLDEQRLGLFLGANDYLVKPVAKAQLLQAIQRVSLDPKRNIQNVAVVDDDPDMLRLVARILEKEHYKVWTFESGEAFLASLATQRPDTVIVDLLMPHIDGFQLIETLREHPTCADIPVMVMTAKVLSEDDLVQLNRCACAVIQKDGTASQEAFHQLVDQLHLMEARKEQYVNNPVG